MREDAIVNFVTSGDISDNSEDVDLERSIEVSPLAGVNAWAGHRLGGAGYPHQDRAAGEEA